MTTHMPPASAWEARARAARREADVFALTADLFWARQDPAGDTWHADYRHALYRHEMSKVIAAQEYAAQCDMTAENIRANSAVPTADVSWPRGGDCDQCRARTQVRRYIRADLGIDTNLCGPCADENKRKATAEDIRAHEQTSRPGAA